MENFPVAQFLIRIYGLLPFLLRRIISILRPAISSSPLQLIVNKSVYIAMSTQTRSGGGGGSGRTKKAGGGAESANNNNVANNHTASNNKKQQDGSSSSTQKQNHTSDNHNKENVPKPHLKV